MHEQTHTGTPPGKDPQGYFIVMPAAVEEDRFEFAKLVAILLGSWKAGLIGGVIGGAIAAGIAMVMPVVFRAETTIAPVQANQGIGGALRNQFGGLAALAGVDLGSSGSRKEESFATLASKGFARDFIAAENLMPRLFAEKWDPATGKWRAGEKPPTMEQAVKIFMRDVSSIAENRKNGLVTITIEQESPQLAAAWANRMVELVNDRLRDEATRSSERSIEYLHKELEKTNVVELRQAIYRLIENQVNNAMLANVQREYAFRVIDRAVAPEQRHSPRRTLLVVVGAFCGGVLAVAFVLVRNAWRREKAARAAVP